MERRDGGRSMITQTFDGILNFHVGRELFSADVLLVSFVFASNRQIYVERLCRVRLIAAVVS